MWQSFFSAAPATATPRNILRNAFIFFYFSVLFHKKLRDATPHLSFTTRLQAPSAVTITVCSHLPDLLQVHWEIGSSKVWGGPCCRFPCWFKHLIVEKKVYSPYQSPGTAIVTLQSLFTSLEHVDQCDGCSPSWLKSGYTETSGRSGNCRLRSAKGLVSGVYLFFNFKTFTRTCTFCCR